MTFTSFYHGLASATATAWLGLAGGLIAFLVNQWSTRRVKVEGVTWEGVAHDKREAGLEHFLPEIHFTVFNGLTMDVGLHHVSMDLRFGRAVRRHVVAPQVGPLVATLKAQHSVSCTLDAREVEVLRRAANADNDLGRQAYRLNVVLGNGQEVTTHWRLLPDPSAVKAATGSGAHP